MVGAIKMDALHDRNHLRFIRSVDYASKSGLDNPDNTYLVTKLHDDGEYKITGSRGTTTGLVFQLLLGQPVWVLRGRAQISMSSIPMI